MSDKLKTVREGLESLRKTIAFDVASTEDFEGVSTVLVGGQQAELVFEAEYSAYLVRRSVDGTAINPSSIGATTAGPITATEFLFDSNTKIYPRAAGRHTFTSAALGTTFEVWDNHLLIRSDTSIEWSSSTVGQVSDLIVQRDAANTLAQRNGTNAQESRLYATYTSSTVYERLSSKYDSGSGAFVIGTEKGASGGSARPLGFAVDGTTKLTITAAGYIIPVLPTSAAGLPTGALWNDSGTVKVA